MSCFFADAVFLGEDFAVTLRTGKYRGLSSTLRETSSNNTGQLLRQGHVLQFIEQIV